MSEPESLTVELVKLYIRYAKLIQRQAKINAELDNVRELIRQQGM